MARKMFKYFWNLWIWKNSFIKNLKKKIHKTKLINAKDITDKIVQDLNTIDCLIIDSFKNNIDEKLFYSILNQSKQLEKIYINKFKCIL